MLSLNLYLFWIIFTICFFFLKFYHPLSEPSLRWLLSLARCIQLTVYQFHCLSSTPGMKSCYSKADTTPTCGTSSWLNKKRPTRAKNHMTHTIQTKMETPLRLYRQGKNSWETDKIDFTLKEEEWYMYIKSMYILYRCNGSNQKGIKRCPRYGFWDKKKNIKLSEMLTNGLKGGVYF